MSKRGNKSGRAANSSRERAPSAAARGGGLKIGVIGLVLLAVIAAGGYYLFTSSQRGAQSRRPNVLLISIDTLRADHLGCYGHAVARTPTMDRLAAEGVRFENAITTAPITAPAHASMLTGLIPPRHGVRDNGTHRLPTNVPTLAETMRSAGYRTAGFVAAAPLMADSGVSRGFDFYDDKMSEHAIGGNANVIKSERDADQVVDAVLRWQATAAADEPQFVFVHFYDPHSPYAKPDATGAPSYDGEIAFVDAQIDRLLTALRKSGSWENAITVVTSDHGEGLGSHSEQTHCIFVYESTLQIPLIVHWPEQISPRQVAATVSVIDVAPTIADLVGAESIQGCDGVSHRLTMSGERSVGQRALYFESYFGRLRFGWAALRGIRKGAMKYIDAPRPELYDLRNDPDERENLIATGGDDDRVTELRAILKDIGIGRRNTIAMDRATRQQMNDLGYLGGGEVTDADDTADPKDRIEAYERFGKSHEHMARGRTDLAVAEMALAEPAFERSPYFYLEWANFEAAQQDWTNAIRHYRKCLALEPNEMDARLNLGVAYFKMNEANQALQEFDRVLAVDEMNIKANLFAGVVCANHLRDLKRAAPYWNRFLTLSPQHSEAKKIRDALRQAGLLTAP